MKQKLENKKTALVFLFALLFLLLLGFAIAYFVIYLPKEKAYAQYESTAESYIHKITETNEVISNYNTKANEIISVNTAFDECLNSAQALIDTDETPYEGEKITVLNNSIKEGRNEKCPLPELKELLQPYVLNEALHKADKKDIETEIGLLNGKITELDQTQANINSEISSLQLPDYTSRTNDIKAKSKDLEESYQIQRQITEPSQDWVMTRLGRVESVATMAPVTEENDPNGRLNKQGGYTATVYFTSPLLGTEELTGDAVIDIGTKGGGAVEVYKTVQEAEARDTYLTTADMYLPSGSHHVFGTMVIRTSSDLKASEQQRLEEAVKNAMIEID